MYFASFSKRHATNLSWEQRKFPEFVEFYNGLTYTPGDVQESGTLVLRSSNVKNGEIADADNVYVNPEIATSENVRKGDIIVVVRNGSRALIGKHAEIKESMPNTVIGAFMTGIRSEHPSFVNALLGTAQFEKEIEKNMGATINQITGYMFSKMEFMIPGDEEQEAIGKYFKEFDNLITLHQCKHNYTPITFSFQKANNSTPSWEQRKLGEISNKVTKKNQDAVVDEVFTNSAEFGIISQRDFFEKDIANAENIDGYYVVEPDDFVYNPRISTTAPFGPIRRNKLERTGAMSPLYYVFRPYDIDLSYLEWYFQTTCWHAFMRFNGNSGARSDRFAITDKIFNEMPISMPQDIEEQKLIGTFLTKLESLITLHQR